MPSISSVSLFLPFSLSLSLTQTFFFCSLSLSFHGDCFFISRGPLQRREEEAVGPIRRRNPRPLEEDQGLVGYIRHARRSCSRLRWRSQITSRRQGQDQLPGPGSRRSLSGPQHPLRRPLGLSLRPLGRVPPHRRLERHELRRCNTRYDDVGEQEGTTSTSCWCCGKCWRRRWRYGRRGFEYGVVFRACTTWPAY